MSKRSKAVTQILRGAWSNLKISEQWMSADGVYIPEEQNLTEINQFRPISLLNVEGKILVWCLQFMLIPKLLWPLLVYEICSTAVEAIEAKINKFTRRWLGVPLGLIDVAMYCHKAKLRLPLKSILEEYKCGKARLLSVLEDSEDPVVKTVQPTIKTSREWKSCRSRTKEYLDIKEVIGQTQTDRKGLGSSTAKW